jgi:hypothetical protein
MKFDTKMTEILTEAKAIQIPIQLRFDDYDDAETFYESYQNALKLNQTGSVVRGQMAIKSVKDFGIFLEIISDLRDVYGTDWEWKFTNF